MAAVVHCEQLRFQSTHPVWGGTMVTNLVSFRAAFQSTHPVWGGTAPTGSGAILTAFQSTHPVWGGTCLTRIKQLTGLFQSTHPVWGGTLFSAHFDTSCVISIHPPRVGWDSASAPDRSSTNYFNPPTPCGVGPLTIIIPWEGVAFQSTHPVWGGTPRRHRPSGNRRISIHPPRVGWDRADVPFIGGKYDFNPPTPCGVGRARSRQNFAFDYFNPPTPCGVGQRLYRIQRTYLYFNPPTPCGVGLEQRAAAQTAAQFQSTHPVWGGTTAHPSKILSL